MPVQPIVRSIVRPTVTGIVRSFGQRASPLDAYPGAAGAYSPMALAKDFASGSPTINAQRNSDEARRDFTYQEIINGDLATWSQSGGAWIFIYYDQSGNTNNLVQATRSAQHQIVAAGVLLTQQEMPCGVSTGTSFYDFETTVSLTGAFSVFSVVEYGVGGNGTLLGATGSPNPRLRAVETSGNWEIVNGDGTVNINVGYSNDRRRLSHIRTAANVNNVRTGTFSRGTASLSGTFSFSRAFSRNNGFDSIDGKVQVLIIYASDQTSNQAGIDAKLNALLKKPKDVFIMLGQSNMVGRNVDGTSATTRANDGNLLEQRNLGGSDEFYGRFLDYYPSGSVTGFGPNVGLSRYLYATHGSRNINIVRFAIGGTSVASFLAESRRLLDPQDDLPPGDADQWASMIAYVNARLAKIQEDSGSSVRIYFVWFQGAEDSNYTGSEGGYTQDLAGMYQTHLTRLLEDLRANVTGATSATRAIIIRSPDWNGNGEGGGDKPGQNEVRAAQVTVANLSSANIWVDSDSPKGVTATWEDASHIDAATQERLGIATAKAWINNSNG